MRCFSIFVALLTGLAATGLAGRAGLAVFGGPALAQVETAGPRDLQALVRELAAEDYAVREAATRAILQKGAGVSAELAALLPSVSDPEARRRIAYILENNVAPPRAVLVLRAAADSGLSCGDLITHVNGRRVFSADDLRQRMGETRAGYTLRATRGEGPRDLGPVQIGELEEICDYLAPRGQTIATAVRLYADGYAEQAYEQLSTLGDSVSPAELSPLLRARMAYTAGFAAEAMNLVGQRTELARSSAGRDEWNSPSLLDLAGPGRAPLRLQWMLLSDALGNPIPGSNDPDLRVQRVLVPANRQIDALDAASSQWWHNYRSALSSDETAQAQDMNRVAGNMLAVTAWMFHELQLASECARLIEPRSAILSSAWMRVQTDAWLAFLGGREQEALDSFFENARPILQRPRVPLDNRSITRNPQVAAILAFFLYQFPRDARTEELLQVVNEPGHLALATYTHWMLAGLNPANEEIVRRHLLAIIPNLSDAEVLPFARAAALLEYIQPAPEADVLAAARERTARVADVAARDESLKLIDALELLARGRFAEARDLLGRGPRVAEHDLLLETATALADPPLELAPFAAELRSAALLTVPLGESDERWVVLTRDRRLLLVDGESGAHQPLARPSLTWLPTPLTWPWLGREANSGRVWVYDRHRVIELVGDIPARFNLAAADIASFDRNCRGIFSALARRAAEMSIAGEHGEFLQHEIVRHGEYVSDPLLPEVGLIDPIANLPGWVHVALRGGAQFLVNTTNGRAWDGHFFAQQIGSDEPLRFFPVALPGAAETIWLCSDQGLLAFEPATEQAQRIELPGPEPHPRLVPEFAPYTRMDARFLYVARLPDEGGQVFRLHLPERRAEALHLVNEVLPSNYYRSFSRAQIRAMLDQRFARDGRAGVQIFIEDVNQVVAKWKQKRQR